MSKLKTKKGAIKRFKLTKRGKIKYATCGKRHLLTNKTSRRLRRMRRRASLASKKGVKYLKRMLPYG